MNQTRRKTTPVLPTSIDFDIPSKYQRTTTGERFLLADRVQRYENKVEQRILVFATDDQLHTLFTSSHILMDGTYDSSPSYFHQIYSIHALKNDQSKLFLSSLITQISFRHIGFVCVIALLGGRSTLIYKELFSILVKHATRLGLIFRPEKITTDFEAAMIKTVAEEVYFLLFYFIHIYSNL